MVVDNFVFGRIRVNANSSRYYICKTEGCSSTLTIQDEAIIRFKDHKLWCSKHGYMESY